VKRQSCFTELISIIILWFGIYIRFSWEVFSLRLALFRHFCSVSLVLMLSPFPFSELALSCFVYLEVNFESSICRCLTRIGKDVLMASVVSELTPSLVSDVEAEGGSEVAHVPLQGQQMSQVRPCPRECTLRQYCATCLVFLRVTCDVIVRHANNIGLVCSVQFQ
jgi:hypothetical protein